MNHDQLIKASIRREMTRRRDELSAEAREQAAKKVARLVDQTLTWRNAEHVSFYVSKGAELDTTVYLPKLIKAKGHLAVPRVDPETQELVLHKVKRFPEGFIKGAFGILEPDPQVYPIVIDISEVKVVFMPGVAFDTDGRRIGYGRGFYDRLLSKPHNAMKVGLAFAFQVVDKLPEEEHDVRLDGVITETGIVKVLE